MIHYKGRGFSVDAESFKGVKEKSFISSPKNIKLFRSVGVRKAWSDIQKLLAPPEQEVKPVDAKEVKPEENK